MYRKTAAALPLMLSGGCSQFPHHRFFTPPAAGQNTAWVRIVGGTELASIGQKLNGQSLEAWCAEVNSYSHEPRISGLPTRVLSADRI